MFEEDYERLHEQIEKDLANFLNQLEAVQSMYSDYSKTNLYREKQIKSRETLESLLTLQFYTSKAIVEVYKTFNGAVEDIYSQLKRIANDF